MTRHQLALSYIRLDGANGYGYIGEEIPKALEQAGAINLPEASFAWDRQICIAPPTLAHHIGRAYRKLDFIYHTMIDTNMVPHDWIEKMNRARAVWVPSEWVHTVFAANGVRTPIFVGGYGIRSPVGSGERVGEDGTFHVLAWGDALISRKNIQSCIRAFIKAALPDSHLTVKLNLDPISIGPAAWKENGVFHPNITIIHERWTWHEISEWFASGHVGLYLSGGEGFGLMPAQMMAAGVPMIMSIHTGMTEYADPNWVLNVPTTEKESEYFANLNIYPRGASEHVPDIDAVVEHLRWSYYHRSDLCELGEGARKTVIGRTWQAAGEHAYDQIIAV